MATRTIEAVVASTAVIPAYGRRLLTEEQVAVFAERYRSGTVPLRGHHDARLPVRSRVVSVGLEHNDEGDLEARVVFEVDERDLADLGPVGGLSVSFTERFLAANPGPDRPPIAVSADALAFSTTQLETLHARLTPRLGISTSRLYQLAEVHEAVVLVGLASDVVYHFGVDVLAVILVEGLRELLVRGRKATTFKFEVTDKGVTGELRTSDLRALKIALKELGPLAEKRGGVYEMRPRKRGWESARRPKRRLPR